MAGRDERHSAAPPPHAAAVRPRWRRAPVVVVLALLVAAGAGLELDAGPRWLGWDWPSPVDEPAAVSPPEGLDLPAVQRAVPVAEPLTAAGELDPAAVRRTLRPFLRRGDMGRRLSVAVAPLGSADPVVEVGAARVVPASTMKLVTAVAALEALGEDRTFRTTAVSVPGTRRVTLVGGGDPLLVREQPAADPPYPPRADIVTLAASTAAALRATGRTRVRLAYDASLFVGERVNPSWPPSYVPADVVAPISALWVDRGRVERGGDVAADPPLDAARAFAAALEEAGITVVGRPRERVAAADATELAAVVSAPVDRLVERAVEVSDNESAEVLAHHVALAEGEEATFEGAAVAVTGVLERLGVETAGSAVLDASGLSRDNRMAPAMLLGVLAVAADEPALRSALTGLPVAGATGSLTFRFDTGDSAGLGVVRAKTGTLTGVHGLAGIATDALGTPFAFVAIADRVRAPGGIGTGGVEQVVARQRVDELAAALVACVCSVPEVSAP
ncbi:MAG: D-alanyl-D-alanine carboxypeptidase/D-alanyl-D-alanine-endopeptidase [Nocardioides sp.]|nr:D-alanyl-D-alanine carboxypeptidase/D-alanyl-D-alanine-endopeptidase [Nocardioides sp.]